MQLSYFLKYKKYLEMVLVFELFPPELFFSFFSYVSYHSCMKKN